MHALLRARRAGGTAGPPIGRPGSSHALAPRRERIRSGAAPALALGLAVPAASASPGDAPLLELLARRAPVDAAGDVDLDGNEDVVVGLPWLVTEKGYGAAVVYSGDDGEPLHVLWGEQQGSLFGVAVAGAGDLDGDGAGDFLVAAPLERVPGGEGDPPGRGVVRVWSGRTGELLHRFDGPPDSFGFGLAARGAGDANQDGFGDLVLGLLPGDPPFDDEVVGRAFLRSGKDGKLRHEWKGARGGDGFGGSVAALGDVDGDRSADVAVASVAGASIRVLSGRTGRTLAEVESDLRGRDWIGEGVAGAGDTNQNGFGDLVIAGILTESGVPRIHSGRDGKLLHELSPPDPERAPPWYGLSAAGGGDANSDGSGDVAVGAPLLGRAAKGLALPPLHDPASPPERGLVLVFSGRDGSVLHELEGPEGDPFFGTSVALAGDVDQDGAADVVVGSGEESEVVARVYDGRRGRFLHELRAP